MVKSVYADTHIQITHMNKMVMRTKSRLCYVPKKPQGPEAEMTVEEPTVALIGPGAIGTTIAAALHEVGRTPLVCGRRAHPQLSLRFDGGKIVVPGPVLTEPASVAAPYDLVFVAVKATHCTVAASAVSRTNSSLRAPKRR